MYGGFYIHVNDDHNQANLTIHLSACKDTDRHKFRTSFHASEIRLPVASLGTCRQMYHDARNVFYSANEFDFYDPKLLGLFMRRLNNISHCSLAMRNVHLYVRVSNKNQEREWDNTFRALAEDLKNLRHISIDVDDCIWNGRYASYTRRYSPAHGKEPFLRGLLELKRLPLKTVELVVTERILEGGVRGNKYIWTTAQKREWALNMKSAIFGSD